MCHCHGNVNKYKQSVFVYLQKIWLLDFFYKYLHFLWAMFLIITYMHSPGLHIMYIFLVLPNLVCLCFILQEELAWVSWMGV